MKPPSNMGSPEPSSASWPPLAIIPGSACNKQVEALLIRKAGDDAEQRPVDARRQPHLRLQRGLVANPHVDAQSAIVLRQRNVGGRIPDSVVDAVDDSLHDRRAGAQETIKRHAELGRHDLARIGRRNGGDAVGKPEASFEVADTAEIFDPVDGEGLRGQAQLAEDRHRKVALEGHVVDRGDDARARPVGVVEIGGRERRLPVMRVNDLGPERIDRSEPDVRANPRKRREPLRIVGPVKPVGPEIRIAGPVVEMRRVDREQVEPGRVAGEDPRRSAEQIVVSMRRLRVGKLGQ